MKHFQNAIVQQLSLVSSQLDAASSLLKYAADDLREILETHDVDVADEVRLIIQNLQAQATAIAGSGAFFVRLAEDQAEHSARQSGDCRLFGRNA